MPSRALTLPNRDVVFVTLDSCRYDVALSARLPTLSSLSCLMKAETPGTYTLPAHVAYFNGFLPSLTQSRILIGGEAVDAIWRSAAAYPSSLNVPIPFAGRTLMEYYHARGYRVIGAGGVTFFDSDNPVNLLPTFFPEFHYFGHGSGPAAQRRPLEYSRSTSLALAHALELAAMCRAAGKFFLFVNCASTHIPYTNPHSALTPADEELIRRLRRLHQLKSGTAECPPLTATEASRLLGMQRTALEWADSQLAVLLGELRDRAPLVVVCADHGEEFGEGGRFGHAHPHESVTTVPFWCGIPD
jgi:Sulfatase